jgi:predicted GNAT family acetyltransferase
MEEQLLKEYVGTYLNPKYNGDWDLVNSKFPELSGVDKQILKEYVGTYLNPKYNGDWDVVNSKFPELFPAGKSSAERPVAEVKKKDTVSPFVDGGSELTKFDPSTGQAVQGQGLPARTEFQYQPGKPLPEQIPSVKPDPKQVELETNPIISFGKKFWDTLSKQIPSAMEAKGAQRQSQFVESDMRKLKSISNVPDNDIIQMPSLTDPRGGSLTSYKAGEYKKQLSEKIARGNKAMQASIELALKLNKDLSNSDVISSLTQVNDGYDLLNFISSSIGQTAAQIPLAIASGGGMSYAMESGNIYLETVKEIAEKEGITPAEVIQQGKDQVALAEIGGAISGALELFGAKKILDAFGLDNIKKDLRKKALTILINSQVEGATEVGQEFVSRGARGLGVEGRLKAPTLTEALDSYAAGMFGAAGIQAPSLLVGSRKTGPEEIVQPVILDYGDSKFGFIRDESGNMEMTKQLDTEEQAVSMSNMLSKSYKGLQFRVEEIVPTDPYKPTKYKIIASEIPAQQETPTYKVDGKDVSVEAIDELIKTKSKDELLAMNIEINNDQTGLTERLQSVLETKPQQDAIQEQAAGQVPVQSGTGVSQEVAQGVPQAEPKGVAEEKVKPAISEMAGESVTVRVGNRNVSGIVEVDEGGKATITEGTVTYEIPSDSEFSEFSRPVTISKDGDFVVNGDSFNEARIVVEDGKKKALLIAQDGTTKAVTNPRVVEEIEYNIALASLEAMNDTDADNLINQYEQQRKTEEPAESATDKTVTESDEDRKLLEAFEEIDLIEELALMELEDVESQAKLVEHTPRTMKEAKTYLVKKNPDGTYQATLNGRKVARKDVLDDLGKLFEQRASEDISKLQEQTNKLKQEVEQKLFGKEKVQAEPQVEEAAAPQVEEAAAQLPKSPADFALELQDKYGVELDFLGSPESETLSVSRIVVPKGQRGQGVGAKVMEEIVAYADSNNKKLVLTPSKDFGGTSVKRLTDFYKRFGFVENKGKNKDFTIRDTMYRSPEGAIKEEPVSKKTPSRPRVSKANKQEIISRPAFTPITLARQWLLSGGKLRSTQSEENKRRGVGVGKGVREETGMGGVEMRQLTGVIDNKRGLSIEVAAERIHENLNEELQASIDVQDIRDAMIEVLLSEDRKTWVDNQDRDTSEDQTSGLDEYIYSQLTDKERADFDQYRQEESYNEYRKENAKKLAKEYDAYVKSKVYQDYIEEVYERNREGRPDAQDQNDGRGQEEGTDAGATSIQGSEQAKEVERKLDELIKLSPNEKGAGQKALDYLDNLLKDYDKIEKEGLGINIALPVIKKIVQGIRALVKTGMSLNDAIKRVAKENGVSVRDVVSNINSVDESISRRRKVTVDEMAALKSQIRLEARAAREAKGDLNTKRRMIADAINKMATEGKITTKKAEAIVKRASRLNVDSEISVNKFIDYVSKVFADAEYASKLSTGNTLRKKIKSISKNKDKAANLRDLGVKFSEIDPSMVKDIEQYNTIASEIFESINGSTLKGGVKFADIVRISDVSDYINDTIEKQNKEILNNKIAEMSELLGVEITEDEYFMLMESINNDESLPKKYKDGAIRKAINKAFDVYSAMINQMMDTGVDPITGEGVSIDAAKKKVVSQFMDMDLSILSDKESLAAIDSLLNFIQNGSTAKMAAVYSRNLGEQKAVRLDKKNFKSSKIKKYFSEDLGQFLVEQFTPLDIVMERMFKGVQKAGDFMFESGISALKKGKSLAQSLNNKIVDKYYNTFYKTKPNNQDFNTLFNTVERGMTAYMMRTKTGSELDINANFKRRKSLINQSIENLNKGNDKNKKLAEVYSEVYDKILDSSNNYDQVVSKADSKNVDAVRSWQSEWANKYQELSDLSESIYNKTLGNDLNYTPDKVSSIGKDKKVDEDSDEINRSAMSFHSNNQTAYQRETGVLMKPTLDDKLPSESFIDLSFDSNNANSMYDALVDLNTANAVRQISGFFNSDSFKNIVPNIDDRKILKGRVNLFIRNIRNKNPYDNDEFAKAVRGLQNLAALGAGRALAGPTQALKQTIPVMANTIVNAGSIDLAAPFNEAKTNFINNSGYAIANRSAASINQIETLNKLSNKVTVSLTSKIADPLLKLNELQLKLFLQKPDAYVARAAWITYYEKSLKQQGIDVKSIDYATHELNDKAADYAQRQVDRQQNISDMDLAGKFVGSKNAIAQFVNKTIMPFSSFRINQSARMGSDWATLTSKTSTKEDKVIAARSLGGFFVELASFRAVSATISVVLASLAALISGKEDDEEDREKLFDTAIKGATTSSIIDIVSFLPYMDGIFQSGIAKGLDVVQDMLDVEDADKFPFYDPREKSVLEGLGMLGIAGQRAAEFIELIDVAYTKDYKDDFGRTKYISEEDSDILKNFVMINILSSVGIASPEIKTMTRRTLANVKRRSTTNKSGIKGRKGSSAVSSRGGGGGRSKTINKSDLKKYYPEFSKQIESATGDEIKAIEKQIRDIKKNAKDQVYGGKD